MRPVRCKARQEWRPVRCRVSVSPLWCRRVSGLHRSERCGAARRRVPLRSHRSASRRVSRVRPAPSPRERPGRRPHASVINLQLQRVLVTLCCFGRFSFFGRQGLLCPKSPFEMHKVKRGVGFSRHGFTRRLSRSVAQIPRPSCRCGVCSHGQIVSMPPAQCPPHFGHLTSHQLS